MSRSLILAAALALMPLPAAAETSLIDTSVLPSQDVYDVATLTPLALAPDGSPAVVLLDIEAGEVVPPHRAESGVRLVTVISGEMSWGDGSDVDEARETVHPQGSILVLPAGVDHWVAARNGALRLQLVILDDEAPAPGVAEQMR